MIHLYDGHEQVYSGRGSVPGVVWNLACETAAGGHDVTVIERQWDGIQASATHNGVEFERIDLWTGADEPWSRVPYEQVTSPYGLGQLITDRVNFALEALRVLRSRSFDVLHVHLPFAANVLLTLAPWLRDRTVYTAHLGELRLDALTDDQRGVDQSTDTDGAVSADGGETTGLDAPSVLSAASPDTYLAKRAAHTTVLNESIRDAFVDRGVDRSSLSVLPNGVDIDRFGEVPQSERDRVRETYDIGEDPVLLFVGTVMPRKGVRDLVTAAGRLERSADLVIAGEDDLDGEYVDEVRQTAREAGVAEAVSLPGFVPEDDLAPLYAVADAFVLPSLEEGFGMTVVEALAAGTPVVGTRVGAVPHIVDDGVHGNLVDPNDPAGLADAIDVTLDTLAASEDIDRVTRERARQYTWESVGSKCESIYRNLL